MSSTKSTLPSAADEVYEFPVSLAQRRFWILDQLEPGNPAYNIAVHFRVEGPLEVEVLERALNELVRRHEVLRTTFAMSGDEPVQVVAPALFLNVACVGLSEFEPGRREAEAQRMIVEEARSGFDLARGPLIRVTLLGLERELHLLLVTMHHSVFDGWSLRVFIDELAAVYESFSTGAASPLPELELQYGDFAVWQQQWLLDNPLAEQLSYWRRRLVDLSPLDLPTDLPRTAALAPTGDIRSVLLPRLLTDGLQLLSKRHDCTLFMTMLAAFKVLLCRYTGQSDIVIGTPIAGRNFVQVEKLIGVFINSLVLRTDLSGSPGFTETLRRVQETVLGAFANQDMPFETLVDELRPKRDVARTPLFQINFIFQRSFMSPKSFAGLTMTPIPSRSPGAIYDLNVFLVERAEGWRVSCEFNTSLFKAATIDRLLHHYVVLLEGILENPDASIAELEIMPPEERFQVVVSSNDTQADYPRSACFHELFEFQAARTPGAVAVVWLDRSLTYGELNRRANRAARRLLAIGIGPEVLVGICMEHCPDMLVALLAVMKVGGAYVPLDPGFPAERLAFMVEDAKVAVLLTHKEAADVLPKTSAPCIFLDRDSDLICQYSADNQKSGVSPNHLAYVLYTSGSTGKPKGVEISHGSLVNFLWSMRHTPGIRPDDVLLSVTTLSFDIAGLELYLPLLLGARVVLATRVQASDGHLLAGLLSQCGATIMQGTPATWRLLLETDWRGCSGFRALVGGEALPRDLANRLLDRCPEVWNLYGPTETTIWSTLFKVVPGSGPVPIGRPIANTRIYILDPFQRPVPIGVAGELHIGGDGLARGYLRRPELTAERFVPDPFAPEEGGRLYKTGDLARYLPDGNIEYLGRMDHQVKVRGFRIELQEIESAIKVHPRVANAVVVARATPAGDSRLAAYLVAQGGEAPDSAECRKMLRRTLPDYMLPSSFTVMESLPLTPNGKIDRRALPDPEDEREQVGTGYVAPRSPMEKLLAEVWEEKLAISPVGIHDNFFDLGGHSLLAMRVVAQIERRTGLRMAPGQFIMATLEQIAAPYPLAAMPPAAQSSEVGGKLLDSLTGLFSRAKKGLNA